MSRHENSNQFKDGLLMDLHPLQTPNTVLTDNLNGTFITYNGNEYSLQNDMGNFKLRNCRLEPKYFPIGTTSYADTIYIVSYNPIDQKVQIGSYPAPVQYNDDLGGRKEKFYTITEAFVLDTFRTNPTTDETIPLTLNTSEISEFTTSTVFSGDEFRLKGGDEISINYDQLITCGFEELVSNVIYDSGKKQKVNLEYNKGYDNVPWSTAGHVELTSRIFDIDKCEVFVANEYYTKTNCHVDFQVDLFISDEGLIKKITNSNNIFNNGGETDSIWINASKFIDSSPEIIPSVRHYKTTKWLGEFLKVSFIVSYDFGLEHVNKIPVIKTYSLDFTPIFNTSITFSNQTGNNDVELKKLATIINFDTKQVRLEHIVDPSKNPFNKVGDKVFNWSKNGNNWIIKANGSKLDDSVGKMFYKVVPVLNNDVVKNEADIESEVWNDTGIVWEDSLLTWKITCPSLSQNNFYYVFYKALEWHDKEPIKETSVEGGGVTREYWEKDKDGNPIIPLHYEVDDTKSKYLDKAELYNTENRTCKVFFTGMPNDNTVEEDRYDMLSFEEFVKKAYNSDSLDSWDVTKEDNLLLDLSTKDDLAAGTLNSGLTKYFKRYIDETIDFPSFVKVGDIPSESTMLYAAQKFIISPESDDSSESSTDPGGIFSNWENSIQCNNGFRTVDVQKNSDDKFEFKGYIGKKCSISVGKQFMFVDGLKYYQLKAKPLSPNTDSYTNQQFHIITIDKNGKSSNNYFIDVPVPNYDGTYTWWPDFKSVDLGNFRSIRMHYPPYHGNRNGGYNEHGCCQVDFGAASAVFAAQGAKEGALNNVGSYVAGPVFAGISALFGAIGGAIEGATKTLDYASIPNFCNYIGNFHKNLRTQLDENWNTNKPVLDGESKTPDDTDTKELQLTGNHATDVALISKTFYRDTAQRPTFTNNSGVNICPTWNKWTEEWNGPDSWDDNKGISAQGCFVTFPLYEKLNQSIDREDWWKVSSSEQHTIPEILGYEEINGVGLVAMSGSPHSSNLNLMSAWVPGNPNAKFERYGRPVIKFANNTENVNFELFPTRILPDRVKDIITRMKDTYTELSELTILNTDKKAFVSGETWSSNVNLEVWDNVEWTLREEYDQKIDEDYENLQKHKIFKYVSFQTNPDTRIQSYPVAGVYPVRENDQLSASNYSVFEGATGFTCWDKFKVDEEGRVFLTNLDSKDNIYVKKNSNKTIFGYFPYLPNCERWI